MINKFWYEAVGRAKEEPQHIFNTNTTSNHIRSVFFFSSFFLSAYYVCDINVIALPFKLVCWKGKLLVQPIVYYGRRRSDNRSSFSLKLYVKIFAVIVWNRDTISSASASIDLRLNTNLSSNFSWISFIMRKKEKEIKICMNRLNKWSAYHARAYKDKTHLLILWYLNERNRPKSHHLRT